MGRASITTILFIPLSAAQFNLQTDWAEASAEAILRRCPICGQDSIVGHGRRQKQAHDEHHDWIRIRRGRCPLCKKTFTFLPLFSPPYGHYSLIARSQALRRYFLEGCDWQAAAPAVQDPDRVADPSTPAPMVPQPAFLPAGVFVFASDDAGPTGMARPDRASGAGFPALALAHRIPVSRPLLALTALRKPRRPPSLPG